MKKLPIERKQKTSESQKKETKKFEGFRNKVYRDSAGHETIGYGHKVTAKEKRQGTFKGRTITKKEADKIFEKDLQAAEDCVRRHVRVKLTQGQFDALVDFVFNVGCRKFAESTLLKKLNGGNYKAVPKELMKWNKVRKNGKLVTSPGLKRRRKAEVKRWKQ